MIIVIFFILIFTSIIWILNKKLSFNVCPICAGVSLTWVGLLIGINLDKLPIDIYQLPTAILAGGTVVGLMSKIETHIKRKPLLIWKSLFVIFGFLSVYSLVSSNWAISILGIILMLVTTFIFKENRKGDNPKESKEQKEIQEKMKNCC